MIRTSRRPCRRARNIRDSGQCSKGDAISSTVLARLTGKSVGAFDPGLVAAVEAKDVRIAKIRKQLTKLLAGIAMIAIDQNGPVLRYAIEDVEQIGDGDVLGSFNVAVRESLRPRGRRG